MHRKVLKDERALGSNPETYLLHAIAPCFSFTAISEQKRNPFLTKHPVQCHTSQHTSPKKQEATILAVLEPYPAAVTAVVAGSGGGGVRVRGGRS